MIDIDAARAQGAAVLAAERKREATAAAYREVFESPAGQLVIADLAAFGGLLEVQTVPGDPCMTHFELGKLATVQYVVHKLRWSAAEIGALAQRRTADTIAALSPEETDA